jgi:hypothetical protein
MSQSPALIAQKLAFQLSPIILTGGIAQLLGGSLPLIAITEALNFTVGLLGGSSDLDMDSFFASFAPLAGGKMIDIQVATVPFANQGVAANAIIQQPLRISLKMTCPARGPGGFAAKLATMTALQASLKLHTNSGGTFTVMTPSLPYYNCLLTSLTDVSAGQPSQPQSIWQWDFYQPLLTVDQLTGAMNTMMSKIDGGLPSDGSLSGDSMGISPAGNDDGSGAF